MCKREERTRRSRSIEGIGIQTKALIIVALALLASGIGYAIMYSLVFLERPEITTVTSTGISTIMSAGVSSILKETRSLSTDYREYVKRIAVTDIYTTTTRSVTRSTGTSILVTTITTTHPWQETVSTSEIGGPDVQVRIYTERVRRYRVTSYIIDIVFGPSIEDDVHNPIHIYLEYSCSKNCTVKQISQDTWDEIKTSRKKTVWYTIIKYHEFPANVSGVYHLTDTSSGGQHRWILMAKSDKMKTLKISGAITEKHFRLPVTITTTSSSTRLLPTTLTKTVRTSASKTYLRTTTETETIVSTTTYTMTLLDTYTKTLLVTYTTTYTFVTDR